MKLVPDRIRSMKQNDVIRCYLNPDDCIWIKCVQPENGIGSGRYIVIHNGRTMYLTTAEVVRMTRNATARPAMYGDPIIVNERSNSK